MIQVHASLRRAALTPWKPEGGGELNGFTGVWVPERKIRLCQLYIHPFKRSASIWD